MILQHRFIESIPRDLEDGVLYISMEFATAMHKCACGCGYIVVTPFSPSDWQMSFNGETVSLNPSIGNWSSKCKSHYFITHNTVAWSRKFSEKEIKELRSHIGKTSKVIPKVSEKESKVVKKVEKTKKKKGFWKWGR